MQNYLVYKNRYNEVKAYEVDILGVNELHTLVKDLQQNQFKTFKSETILSEHSNFSAAVNEAQLRQKEYSILPRQSISSSRKSSINREGKLEVCFTGFKAMDKATLIDLANKANFFTRTEVTKNLDILVCGDNAGPAKLKRAHAQNVGIVIGKIGFTSFIETGEVAE